MTADPHHTEQGPGRPLSASLAASTPVAGASRRPDPGGRAQNAAQSLGGEQDGPQHPDAGAETPDGVGGRQTGAEPLARLRRLRDQLAAERAKAVRADQHPRPDLDHLRVTAHNGIAAGLEIAVGLADHHLREAGEQPARTTANNAVASGDAADNPLREQYAAAIGAIWDGWFDDWASTDVPDPEGILADAVLAVRDQELEQLRARLDEAQQNALALDQGREELFAVIRGVCAAVHVTDDGDVTDWQRGYRACSERALAALDQTSPGQAAIEATGTATCCVCGGGPVVYRNFRELPFCLSCADCQCGENPCVRTGINDPAVSGEAALRTALREVLACLYSLERVGGSLIGYQTVNVIPPARYERWQAVLQQATLDGKEQL